MATVEYLRAQAERRMRLARSSADRGVTDALMSLAADYLERAAELSGEQEQQNQSKRDGQ